MPEHGQLQAMDRVFILNKKQVGKLFADGKINHYSPGAKMVMPEDIKDPVTISDVYGVVIGHITVAEAFKL